ncbi:MAG: hypothetical protein ABSF03_01495 [Streptosporangiaceae bacterium]|jgi:hypothetical protein
MPGLPDQDGYHQFRLLEDAWDSAVQHWHDDVLRDFDTHHWTPLQAESRLYLDALRKLMEVLSVAEHDTEW